MSIETPKVDPKYYEPIGERAGGARRVKAARTPFRVLLWSGIGAALVALWSALRADPALSAAQAQLAGILLTGAGVLAGLGRRESGR